MTGLSVSPQGCGNGPAGAQEGAARVVRAHGCSGRVNAKGERPRVGTVRWRPMRVKCIPLNDPAAPARLRRIPDRTWAQATGDDGARSPGE